MVVYTWWCWHIYKGEEVRVETDQLEQETEAKQVTGGDRTLDWASPACLVMLCSEGADVGLQPDAGVESDLTRRGHVRSVLVYVDKGSNVIFLSLCRIVYVLVLPWCEASLSNSHGRPNKMEQACIGTTSKSAVS